nr:reverse transcriptase domain-containing protein [Tanacetum cinerariifolium]
MSSDYAQSAVTYTSISSDSDGPSWGIPLTNANEFLEVDPYEEVAQQGQVHPLSPAYIPDPMELDEHTPVYVPEPEHQSTMHHQMMTFRSRMTMRISKRILALIDAFTSGSSPFQLPPTSPAYDQVHLGHREAMIHRRDDILEEDMPPRRRFALIGPPPSPGHDTRTIARAADRAEDAQVRRQESANFYAQLLDAQTDRRDIRLKIDLVRGQRTAYETELRMEWQRQSAEDLAVTQMMRIYTLEARARTDTVEDADSSYSVTAMLVTRQGTNDAMTLESIQAMIDWAIQRNSTHTQDDASQSSGEGLRRPMQPACVCSYTDFMKCQPLNFKGTKGVVGLSQWLKKMESIFHISGCAIDNQGTKGVVGLSQWLEKMESIFHISGCAIDNQ